MPPRRVLALLTTLQAANALAAATSKRLPLMPFGADEVLIPGQSRYLHLYEARFLSLFEYCTRECDDDVVLGFFAGDSALLRCATRARVDAWERLDVGVGVTVRGVARCTISDVERYNDQPFMVATADILEDADAVAAPASDANEKAAVDVVSELADEVDSLSARHDIAASRENEIAVDPRAMSNPETETRRTTSLTQRAAELASTARPERTAEPGTVSEIVSGVVMSKPGKCGIVTSTVSSSRRTTWWWPRPGCTTASQPKVSVSDPWRRVPRDSHL